MKSSILLISLVVILGLFVWLTHSFSCIYLFLDTCVMLYIRITARSVFSSKLGSFLCENTHKFLRHFNKVSCGKKKVLKRLWELVEVERW